MQFDEFFRPVNEASWEYLDHTNPHPKDQPKDKIVYTCVYAGKKNLQKNLENKDTWQVERIRKTFPLLPSLKVPK